MSAIEITQNMGTKGIAEDESDEKGTKNMGCGNSFAGGRCLEG